MLSNDKAKIEEKFGFTGRGVLFVDGGPIGASLGQRSTRERFEWIGDMIKLPESIRHDGKECTGVPALLT